MDPATSAQLLTMKDSFARQGINIEAAYRPNGDIEYIYQVGRLLTRAGTVARLQELVPGLEVAADDEQPGVSDLVRLSIDQASIGLADVGSMTVPQVLDFLDEQLPDNPGPVGGVAFGGPPSTSCTSRSVAQLGNRKCRVVIRPARGRRRTQQAGVLA